MKVKLPASFKQYFWDVDFKSLDSQERARFVVARLLERGDEKVIHWLLKNYSKDLIGDVVMNLRGISPRTATFWVLLLGLDKRKVVCLQTPYLQMRQQLWPY